MLDHKFNGPPFTVGIEEELMILDADLTTVTTLPVDLDPVNPADPLQCASTPEGIGPEGGESRYGPTYFDNVSDYDGFSSASAPTAHLELRNRV